MGLDLYAFEMSSGSRLTTLPADTGSWKVTVNTDDTITCTIPARTAETQLQGVWAATQLARNGLLAVADGIPAAAGPIWKRTYVQGDKITLTAGGPRSYWDKRIALPVAARSASIIQVDGTPDPAMSTVLNDISYGTMAKRYVQLAQAWPNGSIPLLLPADVADVGKTKTVNAVDLKTIKTLLDNLTGLIGGPDIMFRPRWNADVSGIYWEMTVGTPTQPRLGNTDASLARWTVGAPGSGAFALNVTEDGTSMIDEAFGTSGASTDKVIYSHSLASKLTGLGYPLLQSTDTTHNDVVDAATMQNYTDQDVMLGGYAASFWTMKARAHEDGSPVLGVDYWTGDMATITVDPAEPVLGAGVGAASYDVPRRIASIGGDINGQSYDLSFAQALA